MKGKGRKGVAVFLAIFWLAWGCGEKPGTEGVSTEKSASSEDQGERITLTPESQKLAEISVEEAGFRSLRREMQFPGAIQVNENRLAHVGPRIQGRVVEVLAGLGDHVEKGEKLAVIDSPELGQSQSAYLMAKAKLIVAEKSIERAKTLLEGKVIGAGEFQRREGDYLAARAEARAAEDRLHLLGMTDTEIAGLGGEDTIRSQVAITAPFQGTIIERHMTLGEVVEPAKPLLTIADLSTLWGIAEVPEQDLSRVKKGLTVQVSVSSSPGEVFRGRITYLSDTVDPSSRTVKARVKVENAGGRLKPEMFATFRIVTEAGERVLAIPEAAVQHEGGKVVVFVEKGKGTFEKRAVDLGLEFQGYYPALSGIGPGERVVTKGAFILKSETLKGLMEEE